MATTAPDPSPLGEAAEGFVELARWFTTLVGNQVTALGRALDRQDADLDGMAANLARSAALPLLGWAAFVNEVFEAASILDEPLRRQRPITSDVFTAPGTGRQRVLELVRPLTNGFGEVLPEDCVVTIDKPVLPADDDQFRLLAPEVPAAAVGVYSGTVTVRSADPNDDGAPVLPADVDVWLVVP